MNKFLNQKFLVRLGLSIIFIVNALTAFFAPGDFVGIIKDSFIAGFLPVRPETFVWVIGLNDSIVGLLLISGIATRRVAIWATAWLMGVTVIMTDPLDMLEHIGLLLVSFSLTIS